MDLCVAWISEQTAVAWISEQTAIISLHSINLSVFITEAECLLRDTNWAFKSDKYSFALKRLTSSGNNKSNLAPHYNTFIFMVV
jgi:hypothetical protein